VFPISYTWCSIEVLFIFYSLCGNALLQLIASVKRPVLHRSQESFLWPKRKSSVGPKRSRKPVTLLISNQVFSLGTTRGGSLSPSSGQQISASDGRHHPSLLQCRCSTSTSTEPARISRLPKEKCLRKPRRNFAIFTGGHVAKAGRLACSEHSLVTLTNRLRTGSRSIRVQAGVEHARIIWNLHS